MSSSYDNDAPIIHKTELPLAAIRVIILQLTTLREVAVRWWIVFKKKRNVRPRATQSFSFPLVPVIITKYLKIN